MDRHLPYVAHEYRNDNTRVVTLAIEIKDPGIGKRARYEAEVASRLPFTLLGEVRQREPFTVCISGYGSLDLEHARSYMMLLNAAVHLCERLTLHPDMPHGLPSPWLEVAVVRRNFKAREARGTDRDRMNRWPETSENDPEMAYAVRRPVIGATGHLEDFAWTLHKTEEEAAAEAAKAPKT